MPTPQFRFTLTWNKNAGGSSSIVTGQPIGWKDAVLKLERHEKFHSLIEYFEAPLLFVGEALGFIRTAESYDGPDVNIEILIEILFEVQYGWETLFDGLLDVSLLEESSKGSRFYKAKIPIIRNDLWAKFISRISTPVDVGGTVDLDGGTRSAIDPVVLNTISQRLRQSYLGYNSQDTSTQYVIPNGEYAILDFLVQDRTEIEDMFNYQLNVSASLPDEKFKLKLGGYATFNFEYFFYSGSFIGSSSVDANVKIKLQINNAAPVNFTQTNETSGIDSWTKYSYSGNATLLAGDTIRIYMENSSGSSKTVNWYANVIKTSSGQFDLETEFPDSETEGFLIHDVGASISDRIIGLDGTFYSEALGHTDYTSRLYASAGSLWGYFLAKGINFRDYLLTEKKYFQSFQEWFESASAIFNLGLTYETISGTEYIRVEKADDFYNDTPSISFYNVSNMIRSYDQDSLYKKIEIGYKNWKSEEKGSIDDPQTKSTYATRFEKIGRDLSIMSEFVAASLAIEITRRQVLEKSKDWRFDDSTFIVSLLETASNTSGGFTFDPEMASAGGTSFTSVTGILNNSYRYNFRLLPVWNFLRHINIFAGSLLQFYSTSVYKFVGGEGNYDASMVMDSASDEILTDEPTIAADQDIDVDISIQRKQVLHLPEMWMATIPMTWAEYQTIKNARKQAIGISQTDADAEPYFIKSLSYRIVRGVAEVVCWKNLPAEIPANDYIWKWESGINIAWESGTEVATRNAP